jgi:SAM-dependent methyltransferase
MKLSYIIAYKNKLDELTPLDTTPLTHDKLTPLMNIVKDNELQFTSLIDQMEKNYFLILNKFDAFDQTIENIKSAIVELIRQKESLYYEESMRLYQQEIANDSAEHILDRRLPIFDEVVEILKVRLKNYGDWHHSGLIIRPGHEDWIRELVALDPLYLVDQAETLLDPAVLRFNDQYQRRLRTYTLVESLTDPMMPTIPNGQFGFCLVYNFFNYKPIEVIEAYLREIYTKLKPGGTVALTFNDCDRSSGTELFERNFMCYTPGHAVISRIESLGYEITYNFRTDSSNTWLEIKKPGTLTSMRGGQSLAKVLYKDEYTMYTKEQIKNIRQQAHDLNIASTDELEKMPVGQIVEFLKQRTSK